MLFEQTTVGEFLQQTLICQAETPIQDILHLLQTSSGNAVDAAPDNEPGSDRSDLSQLVVVNEQQQPISLIPLSQFIRLFFAEQESNHSLSPQQPIAEWVNLHNHPLQCVPKTYSLKQFWQYLQALPQDGLMSWAIVEDAMGEYLGLLDTPRLIQFLAHQAPLSVAIKFSSDLKSTISPALELSDTPPSTTTAAIFSDSVLPEQSLSPELLAEISHELKSPLTSILSLSNVLSHQGIQTLSERQLQYVQLIHQNSQQLMSVVNNMLDLTQLPTQTQPEPRSMVDLDLLCADAIAQAKRYYLLEQGTSAPTTLTIQQEPNQSLGGLAGNELKLRQILVHLLHNALGLVQGQSTVDLRVRRWQRWVIFTISDHGFCIPYHQQPLIFQVPQTWTNPDAEHLSKTGLGLILAQRLAEQMSSNITFMSGPDRGNVFSLYVPTESIQNKKKPKYTKGLVLLVATEPDLIYQVHQHLAHCSLRVVIARSESEIYQRMKTFQPQAIILQTAVMTTSGWDILAMLKQQENTRPVLLIGNELDCQQALHLGANRCLTLESLNQGLDEWLEEWRDNTVTSQPRIPQNTVPKKAIASPRSLPKSQKLTILHLDGNFEQVGNTLPIDISQSLYEHQWRVVSTTTLEEAELLANIWKPDVILYTADDPDPFISMAPESPLIQYFFVILDSDVYQTAHQRDDLKVYTRSSLATLGSAPELLQVSLLLQVLNNTPVVE